MKQVYQIGNQRLHIHSENNLIHEADYQTRSRTRELPWSPYTVPSSGRWLYNSSTIRITGMLLDVAGVQQAEQILQSLKSEIGEINDIVAYDFIGLKNCQCVCRLPSSYEDDQIVWLHNVGKIEGVSIDQSDVYSPFEIDMEIELLSFWEPLNPFMWYFGSTPESPLDPYPVDPDFGSLITDWPHPGLLFSEEGKTTRLWVRRNLENDDFLYNPRSWELCADPRISDSKSWTAGGWNSVNISKQDWGALPRTMYGFTRLPTSGTVTMRMLRERKWGREEETITMDLSQLDSDLAVAGYSGLRSTDIVVIGDVTRLPGVVIRAGSVLDISPLVRYSGFWPGVLHPGQNRFFADPAGGWFAYQVIFRRL